jgi:hypothetical protein
MKFNPGIETTAAWYSRFPPLCRRTLFTRRFGPEFPDLGTVSIGSGLETAPGQGLSFETVSVNTAQRVRRIRLGSPGGRRRIFGAEGQKCWAGLTLNRLRPAPGSAILEKNHDHRRTPRPHRACQCETDRALWRETQNQIHELTIASPR